MVAVAEYQQTVEGDRDPDDAEAFATVWKAIEGCGRPWKGVEALGRCRKTRKIQRMQKATVAGRE